MFRLDGKTILVTGASGGIGASIARVLHAQGATVALSGTRREALDALAGELQPLLGMGSLNPTLSLKRHLHLIAGDQLELAAALRPRHAYLARSAARSWRATLSSTELMKVGSPWS